MFRFKVLLLTVLVMLLVAPVLVQAQLPLSESYNNGTITFQYPNGFAFDEATLTLTNNTDTFSMTFIEPSVLFLGVEPARALELSLNSRAAGYSEVTEGEAETRPIAMTELDEGGKLIAISFARGDVGMVLIEGEYALQESTVMAILASYGEPCVVWTDDADTVKVRVGPGTNRSSVAFLPAGEHFAPEGQTADDDGAVWYQLDPALAAPDRLMNEAWVAAADVDSAFTCAAVSQADAPPLIPLPSDEEEEEDA